jgi:hypothetical protein
LSLDAVECGRGGVRLLLDENTGRGRVLSRYTAASQQQRSRKCARQKASSAGD